MFNIYRKFCNKCYCNNCSNCNKCYYNRYKCSEKNGNREYSDRGMDKFDITMEQMIQMQNQGAVLCDIRSPQEYNERHLPRAILLPEYEIYRNAQKIFPNKNQLIIVYCGTGSRSYSSLKKFQRLGYTNVYNLYKGTENY